MDSQNGECVTKNHQNNKFRTTPINNVKHLGVCVCLFLRKGKVIVLFLEIKKYSNQSQHLRSSNEMAKFFFFIIYVLTDHFITFVDIAEKPCGLANSPIMCGTM